MLADRIALVRQQRKDSTYPASVSPATAEDWKRGASKIAADRDELEKRIKEEALLRDDAKKKLQKKQQKLSQRSFAVMQKRLLDAQEALRGSQDALQELEKNDKRQRSEFNETQLTLQRLVKEEKTVERVKKVLVKCLGHLNNFKEHLRTFRRFFAQLHVLISKVDKIVVKEFLMTGQRVLDTESAAVRSLSLKHIKSEAYKLLANYHVAGHIAQTYVVVSQKHIMPGVTDLNQSMLKASPDTMQGDIDAINTFAKKAQSQISKLADQRRASIEAQLFETKRQVEEVQGYMLTQASDAVDDDAESEDEWDTIDATGPMANLAVAA